ncbi:MAG TPA: TadE/TadG family type IV pilus assembly protein [Gemmataceae bacterium]|nr:TadE/TadG family type IV pilus assembly protein [Gemmataceae bacterium]
MRRKCVPRRRAGAAALEFAIACPLLFLIFLGMVEIGRAMMVAGSVANAARVGARSAAVSGGSYSSCTSSVAAVLSDAGLPSGTAPTVTVNGVAVTDDASFQAAAVPGATITVQVSLSYSSVSWVPGGGALFMSPGQSISASTTMTREG